MTLDSDSGSHRPPGEMTGHILLECDRSGRILAMTPAAHAAFGGTTHLLDAMRQVAPTGTGGLLRLESAARFSPVFQQGDTIWISAELAARAEAAVPREGASLAMVESGLLRHFFRLQDVERELSARTRRLRRGTATVLQIERERQRLGRELHTTIGQILAAIRLQLEIVVLQLAGPPAPVQEALDRIGTLASEALDCVRTVSKRLHPPEWQRLSLADALQQLWEMSGVPQRFEAALHLDPLPAEPPLETRILLYRGAQEALSNLVRHSRATRAEMTLRSGEGRLVLGFRDNGVGFDAAALFAAPPSVGSGLGLRSIREQAEALGGNLVIQSGPNGTTLELSGPLWGERP